MDLDYTTLSLVITIISIMASIVMFFLWKINSQIKGPKYWFIASSLAAIGFLALFYASPLERGYRSFLNNVAALTATLLMLEGILQFRGFGETSKRKGPLILLMIGFIVLSWFTKDDAALRFLLHDPLFMVMLLLTSFFILYGSRGGERWAHIITALSALSLFGGCVYRFAHVVTGSMGPSLDPHLLSVVFLLVMVYTIGWALSLSIAVNYRINQGLIEAKTVLQVKKKEIESIFHHLDDELKKAKDLYHHLIETEIPLLPGISIKVFQRPAAYIGGDFWRAIERRERLILYIADITGHGLDGTIFSMFVRNAIDTYIFNQAPEDLTTENILDHLDQRVRSGVFPSEYNVAIFLIILDLETKEMLYSGAGFQNPPLLIGRDGSSQFLISKGLPISSNIPREVMNFHHQSTSLRKGSYLFLSTDGLYELDNGTNIYEERLLRLLKECPGISLDTINHRVQQDFLDFLGERRQDDDITYVILSSSHKEKE